MSDITSNKRRNIKQVIEKETENLNAILETKDLSYFKEMVDELRDTWGKRQMFRTETEARFSVLQENRYPTKASKYWQCVREQSSFLNTLIGLSFEYRRNEAKIKWYEEKIDKEENEYKKTLHKINLDETLFKKANYEREAKERIRELKMWSKIKSELNDGSFNDKDVNEHQLESYGRQYALKAQSLTEHSDDNEKWNVLGQLSSLQRIKKNGELENRTEKKEELPNIEKK